MKNEQFLPIPHCPTAPVSLCAVGAAYPAVIAALEKQNIEVFVLPEHQKLSAPVSSHADLQLGLLKGDSIAVGKGESALKQRLEDIGFHVLESEQPLSNEYPQEALLDFCALGDTIIGNSKIIEKKYLLKYSQVIDVKQGYTKCNLAIVSPTALITSDISIAKACTAAGFDVLQIHPGFIELPDYDTGFIGGCCGLIAPDLLAVCGDLQSHPDYKQIQAFLNKHHVSVLTLCGGNLKDIGGILPLKQRPK